MSINSIAPAKNKQGGFEHGAILGGNIPLCRVSSQWKSTSCSNKYNPCILETSLVSDPPLQQVVSHTIEAGVRGSYTIPDNGLLSYKVGMYRIQSTNDIVSEASEATGQGFYVNVPETLRQGLEVGLRYEQGPWSFYANYAYVDATYQFDAAFSSPNNPYANDDGQIFVHKGDHIPGIPNMLGKIGGDYQVTPQFKVGMDALFVGSQYYVGDDSNQNPKLPVRPITYSTREPLIKLPAIFRSLDSSTTSRTTITRPMAHSSRPIQPAPI